MKKLFIYKKNNNYYKDIFNFYEVCKKFDQKSCLIIDHKNIKKKIYITLILLLLILTIYHLLKNLKIKFIF